MAVCTTPTGILFFSLSSAAVCTQIAETSNSLARRPRVFPAEIAERADGARHFLGGGNRGFGQVQHRDVRRRGAREPRLPVSVAEST